MSALKFEHEPSVESGGGWGGERCPQTSLANSQLIRVPMFNDDISFCRYLVQMEAAECRA
jgi:hypothetical protein